MNRRELLAAATALPFASSFTGLRAFGAESAASDYALLAKVGGLLAEGAVSHIGAAVVEQQLNDLGIKQSAGEFIKENLKLCTAELKRFIEGKFLEDNIGDATADMETARDELRYYLASPATSKDRLKLASDKAASASNQLELVGIPAFTAFVLTVDVQLNLQEERIKAFGPSERKVSVIIIDDAVALLNKWEDQWKKLLKKRAKIVHSPASGIGGVKGGRIEKPETWMVFGDGFDDKFERHFPVVPPLARKGESEAKRHKARQDETEGHAEKYLKDELAKAIKKLEKGPIAVAGKSIKHWEQLKAEYA